MIKTAVCEDEAPARAYLVSLIRAQPCSCQIVEYASSDLDSPGRAAPGTGRRAAACDCLCHRL